MSNGAEASTPPPPRWLVGPWSRWLRDWADILRLSFLVATFVLLALGEYSEATRLGLTFLVALIPRLLATPWPFDLAFAAGMSLQAWGNVSRIFYTWLVYHDIVHFELTGAVAILLYFVLVFLRLAPDLARNVRIHQKAGIATLTFAIGSTVNAGYEQYEWFVDHDLHGHLLENYHHTMFDLFFGGLGSVAAGVCLALWSGHRSATRRRQVGDPFAAPHDWLERRVERSGRRAAAKAARRRRHPVGVRLESSRLATGAVGRVLLGDWTRPLRDVNDLARLSLLVGFALAVSHGNADQSLRFALTLLVSLAARRLQAPRVFEGAFNAALLFQAWGAYAGSLHAHSAYDDATNFVLSAAATPVLYLLLIRVHVLPDLARGSAVHRRIGMFAAAMCLGLCVGIYYEQYVWVANHYLGASVPTSWGGLVRRLGLDWAGSIVGALALIVWDVYGWGTRRRLGRPGKGVPVRRLTRLDAATQAPATMRS